MNKKMDFWVIVGLLIVLMGFMLSMNNRMATKADLARVEADIREIRSLLMTHIAEGHKGHTHKKKIALADKQRPK